jgi:hypothetical protein
MAVRSEAKSLKSELRVKNRNTRYFDAKLSFVLLVSLRSAIFSEIEKS